MKITARIISNVDMGGMVKDKLLKASSDSLKEVIVLIAHDAKRDSPWLTGNNSRSIDYEAKGLKGSVFSTSKYGGWLEIGSMGRDARPYMKPALDRHIGKLNGFVKDKL